MALRRTPSSKPRWKQRIPVLVALAWFCVCLMLYVGEYMPGGTYHTVHIHMKSLPKQSTRKRMLAEGYRHISLHKISEQVPTIFHHQRGSMEFGSPLPVGICNEQWMADMRSS
ncbi:hypothetical protein WJX72_010610 [[Myrmecia] bisecta]|uniref:Hexosyltransferase n=1 Tax=[Myrmecia] bisecta TaxID=41462 RepID=A0AAW1QSM4_9CHLO